MPNPFSKSQLDVPLEGHSISVPKQALEFTSWYSNKFTIYMIDLEALVCDTNTAQVGIEVSGNGGSTYISSGYLSLTGGWQLDTGTGAVPVTTGAIMICNSFGTGVARGAVSGSIKMTAPGNSVYNKAFSGDVIMPSSDGHWYNMQVGGVYNSALPFNAFRIRASSGNFTSGAAYVRAIRTKY